MSEAITVERLERALALCAYLVTLDGPKRVPLFERLERELTSMRQTEDAVPREAAAGKLALSTARSDWKRQR